MDEVDTTATGAPPERRMYSRTSMPLGMRLRWGNAPSEVADVTSVNLSFEGLLLQPDHDQLPDDIPSEVQLSIDGDAVFGEVAERTDRGLRVRFVHLDSGFADRIYQHLVSAPDTALVEREFDR